MNKEQRKALREMGWKWHKFYISKYIGKYELDIEFCIGDCCVGVYENKFLVEPKYRASNFWEALWKATEFEHKYAE